MTKCNKCGNKSDCISEKKYWCKKCIVESILSDSLGIELTIGS